MKRNRENLLAAVGVQYGIVFDLRFDRIIGVGGVDMVLIRDHVERAVIVQFSLWNNSHSYHGIRMQPTMQHLYSQLDVSYFVIIEMLEW